MNKREIAIENFKLGYNCAQSVVLAFQDEIKVDKEFLLKMASPFGAGIASLRDVCGAVSGMIIVFGILYGYDQPKNLQVKTEVYNNARSLIEQFKIKMNSHICRDLIAVSEQTLQPHERDASYYSKRKSCIECVGSAAEIIENYIKNNPIA